MHSIIKSTLAVFGLFALASQPLQAQFLPSKYEIGLNAGTLIYQGDLSESPLGYTRGLRPAVGVYASDALDDYFALRATLSYGHVGADESIYASPAYRRHRNFEFTSPITEFSTQIVWDLFGKTYKNGFRRLSPYFFVGVGVAFTDVHKNWRGFDTAYFGYKSSAYQGLAIDTLHRAAGIVPVLPIGAGLRYMISNHFILNGEATYRITTSDYIDGFKYAADPTKNDHYYGFTIGLAYRFGNNRMSCPKKPT